MSRQIKLLVGISCTVILLLFILFVINQTAQVYQLASAYHPLFGQAVLYTLTILFICLLSIPVWQYIKMPRKLVKPDTNDTKAMEVYQRRLVERLRKNPELRDEEIDWHKNDEAIARATANLDSKANHLIKEAASITFVTTAVSQSGRLDGLMVLVNQVRMVWQIAHLYNQRPGLTDMLRLYANVAVTAFVVKEMEDMELLDEQVEPLITSIVTNYSLSVLPGSAYLSTLITTSLLNGSANAFLTLRVGILARKYSSPNEEFNRGVRKLAALEASRLLGTILYDSSKLVTKSIIRAAKKSSANLVDEGKQKAGQVYARAVESVKEFNSNAVTKSKESISRVKKESLDLMKKVYSTLSKTTSSNDHVDK